MKSKIEIGILAGLIILLSVYIIFRDNRSINYDIPELTSFEKEDVTKILYNEFEIGKRGEEWFLPSGYKAEEYKIERLISDAAGIKLIDMISDTKDYQRFGLDEENSLKVYKKDQLLLELLLGNTSNTGNYTYIKLPGRSEVYSVRGDLKNSFDKSEEDLRNRVVLTLEKDKVTEIKVIKEDSEVVKSGEDLTDLLNTLDSLNANSFKDLDRSKELLTIEIVGEVTKRVTVYEKVDDEYPATSTDVDFPFTLPSWIINKFIELN